MERNIARGAGPCGDPVGQRAETVKKSWPLKRWQKGQAGSEHANRENAQYTFCKNSSAWGLCEYHVSHLAKKHCSHHGISDERF